jgi:hypothetical protein
VNRFFIIVLVIASTALLGGFSYTNLASESKPDSGLKCLTESDVPSFTLETDSKSKPFEGKLCFIEKNLYDTTKLNIYVRGRMIRVDFMDGKGKQSLIFDLKNSSVIALEHSKKLYYDVQVNDYKNEPIPGCQFFKTGSTKKIAGIVCHQWRIKNVKEKTEVALWVSGSGFGFFSDLLKLWNRTERPFRYFLLFNDKSDNMPLQWTERTLLRDLKSSAMLTDIEYQTPDLSLFSVPETYSLYVH